MRHTRAHRQSARRGFTIIEVMVGVTIGAILLLGVRQACVGLADLADATLARARAAERAANGERMLRRIVGDMLPDSNSTGSLVGDSTRAEFDTWCAMPKGWQERCRARLVVGTGGDSHRGRIEVHFSTGSHAIIWDKPSNATFVYLVGAIDGGLWRAEWEGRLGVPLALGVVTDHDTLIVPAGVHE